MNVYIRFKRFLAFKQPGITIVAQLVIATPPRDGQIDVGRVVRRAAAVARGARLLREADAVTPPIEDDHVPA